MYEKVADEKEQLAQNYQITPKSFNKLKKDYKIVKKRDKDLIEKNEQLTTDLHNQKEKIMKCHKQYEKTINMHFKNKTSKFGDLLKYLSKINIESKNQADIHNLIFIPNKAKNVDEIVSQFKKNEDESIFEQVGLYSNAFEMLYSSDLFDNTKLVLILKNFSKIAIEVR